MGDVVSTADRARWSYGLSAALDTYIQTYPLATSDTTETITEFNTTATLEGQSARRARHRWRARADLVAGNELFRQRLEAHYFYRPDQRQMRLRLDARWFARQYRQDTDYSLSSDNDQGRVEARVVPLAGAAAAWDLRASVGYLRYRQPSTLEQNRRDTMVATFLRSSPRVEKIWGIGLRAMRRDYPDSTEISRDIIGLEFDYEAGGFHGEGLRVFHRSERRQIADQTVRPSAWTHWTDLRSQVEVGPGQVILDLENEIWLYDYETSAYINSWRVGGVGGYRLGNLMELTGHLGVTGELFNAGTAAESYQQTGLRAGVESYGSVLSGWLSVEYGHRVYRRQVTLTDEDLLILDDPAAEIDFSYSNFNYWALWINAVWRFTPRLSFDLIANYQPETHTEKTDDTAIGFASIRLVWRH